jgi:hypothetical protein
MEIPCKAKVGMSLGVAYKGGMKEGLKFYYESVQFGGG